MGAKDQLWMLTVLLSLYAGLAVQECPLRRYLYYSIRTYHLASEPGRWWCCLDQG
jgi:hypothetical protein